MSDPANVPYRWDLVTPDRLGSLLDGTLTPRLWFLDDLVRATGQVLARSGGGPLVFVGRSVDSMFDLLSGALSGVSGAPTLARLPVSFARPFIPARRGGRDAELTPAQIRRVRDLLGEVGASPTALVSRRRPTAFVDVVHEGSTFTDLYGIVRDWLDEEHLDRNSIRRKLRFVGVTSRKQTSPKTFRWQQHAPWTSDLPANGVVNVSLDEHVWGYLGNHQVKLTRTFPPSRWTVASEDDPIATRTAVRPLTAATGRQAAESFEERRERLRRDALAEAVAIVEAGRSPVVRSALSRAAGEDPNISQPWLRDLVTRLTTR